VLVGGLMALTALIAVLRAAGSGAQEGWWALGFLAAFFVLSLSESILMAHQGLPWVLFLAALTRAVLPSSAPSPAPLVEKRRRAYQTAPRIVSQYPYGSHRRAFPVR
jgi:hypothetical protein